MGVSGRLGDLSGAPVVTVAIAAGIALASRQPMVAIVATPSVTLGLSVLGRDAGMLALDPTPHWCYADSVTVYDDGSVLASVDSGRCTLILPDENPFAAGE